MEVDVYSIPEASRLPLIDETTALGTQAPKDRYYQQILIWETRLVITKIKRLSPTPVPKKAYYKKPTHSYTS